jgi:sulfur carrier protein
MMIQINGRPQDVRATTLQTLLLELGYDEKTVGTALNQEFVRAKDRAETPIREGDAVEIVTPRQGG